MLALHRSDTDIGFHIPVLSPNATSFLSVGDASRLDEREAAPTTLPPPPAELHERFHRLTDLGLDGVSVYRGESGESLQIHYGSGLGHRSREPQTDPSTVPGIVAAAEKVKTMAVMLEEDFDLDVVPCGKGTNPVGRKSHCGHLQVKGHQK
ncbi:unnamed protein product [Pleuronectes platessa]|uniref:Uncharacterized protein n=1 Tax=Pleuronectes platessa TaxID=8262 RepID=A0A9N7YKV0_PLEPL|nr:unnamed protein product [Pleuronectes platessa]